MRRNLHVWSLGTLLIAIPLAVPAAGAATSPDGDIDEQWANMPRQIERDIGARAFTVTVGDLQNGTDLQRYTFDGRTATLTWSLHNATSDDEPVPSVEGTMRVNSILEYEDVDGDGRLGLVDNVERAVRSSDMLFPWITAHEPTPGQHRVDVHYTLPDAQRGTFTLRFTFNERPTSEGNDTLLPSEVRVAIEIERYQYRRVNGTQLAVDLRITGDPDRHGSALFGAGAHDYRPHLDWNRTAIVDRELVPTGFTVEHSGGTGTDAGDRPAETLLAISYPRGNIIEHHIQIGHTHTLSESPFLTIGGRILGEWRVFTLGIILAAILVAGAAYPHIRSRS